MAQRMILFVSAFFASVAAVACHSSNNATPTSSDASRASDGGDYNTDVVLDAGPFTAVSPDGGVACVGNCNYQTQSGCAAGLMCHPQVNADQTVSAGCQTAGTVAAAQDCTWATCQPGYICTTEGGIIGHCRHMCCGGDWSVCAPNESCTGAIALLPADASASVSAGVGVCEPVNKCDVLDPESCPTGQSCYIIDSRGDTKCLAAGSRDLNQTCSGTDLCRAGLSCFVIPNPNGSNLPPVYQCRRLCRAVPGGGLPGCPTAEGTVCSHSSAEPPGVGECVTATSF